MKVTLDNGITITGTEEQIREAITKLGKTEELYTSSTGDVIPIKTMASPYVRNAILKCYRNWVENLRGLSMTDRELLKILSEGPTDKTLLSLLSELTRRTK